MVVALVAVLATEDRLAATGGVVGGMRELGERADEGCEPGEAGGRETCLFAGTLAVACVAGVGELEDGDMVTDIEPDIKPFGLAPAEPLRPVRIGMTGGVGDSLFASTLLDPAAVKAALDVGGKRSKLGVDALAAPLRFPESVPRSAAC